MKACSLRCTHAPPRVSVNAKATPNCKNQRKSVYLHTFLPLHSYAHILCHKTLMVFPKNLPRMYYQIVIKLFQAAFFNTIFFDKFFFGPVQQKIVKWKFKTILMTHSSFSHSKTPIQFHQTSLVLNFRSKEIFGFRTCHTSSVPER